MAIQSSVLEVREIKTVPYVPRRMQAWMDIYQNRIFGGSAAPLALGSYRWQKRCRGLYQTPIAA